MSPNKNALSILSTYVNKLWGFVSVFLFIPIYIRYLGMEAYAVIGFYALLLGVISFADAGLSSAVTREFAAFNTANYKYSILRLIEKIYALICISIALLIFFCAPIIAEYWLTSKTIPITTLTYYIRLIGVGISIQLISSLYYGALFGIDYQVQANFYQVVWSVSRSLGAIVVMLIVGKTLEVFFICQIICNVIYVFKIRTKVITILKGFIGHLYIEIKKLPRNIMEYVGGMSLVAIISSINSQVDKIVISSAFSLTIYGYYTLVSSLSQLPTMLSTPLAVSLFPRFSNLASENKLSVIKKNLMKFSFVLNVIVFIVYAILLFYPSEILYLWTKDAVDPSYMNEVVLTIRLLSTGSTFLALQLLLFYALLSFGKTKYTIYQGAFQVVIGVPLSYSLVNKIGLAGAGISWTIINLGAYIFLFIIVSSKYVKFNKATYLFYYTFVPLLMSISIFGGGYLLYSRLEANFIVSILISTLLALLLNLLFYNDKNNLPPFSFKHLLNF